MNRWEVTIQSGGRVWAYAVEAETSYDAGMKASALAADDGYDCRDGMPVTYKCEPLGLGEWDGFPSQRDLVAAMVYNARAQSPREMTPERWARIRRQFRISAEQCLEQADRELEDM